MNQWSTIFLVLSPLASLCLLFQKQDKILWLFIPFLSLRLALEQYSAKLSYAFINNHWVINILTIVSISFYVFMLSAFINNTRVKQLARYFSFIFPAFFILSGFLLVPFVKLHIYEFSIGSFVVVSLCIYYFYELLNYPNDTQLLWYPPFWIVTGLLFNYAGELPVSLFLNFIITQKYSVLSTIFFMLHFLNIMLNILLIIAFVCRLIRPKRSLSYS